VQWPEVDFRASSPPLDFHEYCTGELTPDLVTEAMAGDFQRILDYPALGFASEQPVPPSAMAAYRLLTAAGLTGQLR
jgi:hypothetical protein